MIAVHATGKIICNQKKSVCTAQENVRVTQGEYTLNANVVRLTFKNDPDRTNKRFISTLRAQGDVKLTAPTGEAFGERADYDHQTGRLSLSGQVKLKTEKLVLTSPKPIVYTTVENQAHVENPILVFEERRTALRADHARLTFESKSGATGKTFQQLQSVLMTGNCLLASPQETVSSEEALYLPENECVTLKNDVSIVQNMSLVTGACGCVDQAGARLFSSTTCKETTHPTQRIKGIVYPKQQQSRAT